MFAHIIYYPRISLLRGYFYYKLKRPLLLPDELALLHLIFEHKGRLTNQELYDLFYQPSLDRATIIRKKTRTLTSLERRIQGMFMSNDPLYEQVPDLNDKRSHIYVFNRRYLAY